MEISPPLMTTFRPPRTSSGTRQRDGRKLDDEVLVVRERAGATGGRRVLAVADGVDPDRPRAEHLGRRVPEPGREAARLRRLSVGWTAALARALTRAGLELVAGARAEPGDALPRQFGVILRTQPMPPRERCAEPPGGPGDAVAVVRETLGPVIAVRPPGEFGRIVGHIARPAHPGGLVASEARGIPSASVPRPDSPAAPRSATRGTSRPPQVAATQPAGPGRSVEVSSC